MRHARDRNGQATVELVALLPLVALFALVLWQAAVAGQAAWLAGAGARAAARARAVGLDPEQAARGALPPRLERGMRIEPGRDGTVSVHVEVPSVAGPRPLTKVAGRARFEPQSP
jgi:hypothetical protein